MLSSKGLQAFARRHFYVISMLVAVGCSTSGGMSGGCAAMQPLPNGRYTGPKTDNAVNIRLSQAGIGYLNSNWQSLVSVFAPGNQLTLPIACSAPSFPVLGVVRIADQNRDYTCNPGEVANVAVTVTGFSLTPASPDKLNASISLSIDTGKIYATIDGSICNLRCSVRFNSAANSPVSNQISATIKFSIDTKWDKLLAFEVSGINGTQICGASGAPAEPQCINVNDLDLSSEGGVCSLTCSGADWDPVKTFVLQQLSPTLQTQIQTAVKGQSCEACGTGLPACPQYPGAVSTCMNDVCTDAATMKCVPRFLGTEGRVAMGAFLGSFGAPANSQLDLSIAAGSSVAVDTGLSMGTRAGITSVNVASCVPQLTAPALLAVTAPNFEAEAGTGSAGFHVGLGISSSFLNTAFFQAHQSGALCLQLSTANVGLINTGLFKTFLPSLGKLATRDGKDAPMMVALRPAKAPTITVGQGTYDAITKKPIKPLITIALPELSIDFYAQIDDRMTRLFTLTADITLPLSLIFEGCDKVSPAIGDLRMLISNIKTSNSEMLAEDPNVLADLIPAVVGLAEPALANALKPFALPALGNFKLKVNETKGLGNISGTDAYNHLGLYATLLPSSASCAVSSPRLMASLKRSEIPTKAQMKLTGHGMPLPKAILSVGTTGKAGTSEYSVRVDSGLWSEFHQAVAGEFEVTHPRFLLQGQHTIEVRARVAEDAHGISQPEPIGFTVDWDAPDITITTEAGSDLLKVTAVDQVSPANRLEFAYALGEEAFSGFGPAREVSLRGVEAAGGVRIQVRDEQGNVAEARWNVAKTALRPADAIVPVGETSGRAGCSATSGWAWLALLGLALVFKRRT